MKAKNQNSVIEYDEVKVKGTDFTVDFRKTVNDNGTHVSAIPRKDGKEAGFINYKSGDSRLTVSLSDVSAKDCDSIKQLLSTVAECLKEILQ